MRLALLLLLAAIPMAAAVIRKDLPPGPQGLLVSVQAPAALGQATVSVELRRQGEVLLSKLLHAGDGDLFTYVGSGAGLSLYITHPANVPVRTIFRPLPTNSQFEAEPNNSWSNATPFRLGQPVLASGDEAP